MAWQWRSIVSTRCSHTLSYHMLLQFPQRHTPCIGIYQHCGLPLGTCAFHTVQCSDIQLPPSMKRALDSHRRPAAPGLWRVHPDCQGSSTNPGAINGLYGLVVHTGGCYLHNGYTEPCWCIAGSMKWHVTPVHEPQHASPGGSF